MARGQRGLDELPIMIPNRYDENSRSAIVSAMVRDQEVSGQRLRPYRDLALRQGLMTDLRHWAEKLHPRQIETLAKFIDGRDLNPAAISELITAEAPRDLRVWCSSADNLTNLTPGESFTTTHAQAATLSRSLLDQSPPGVRGLDIPGQEQTVLEVFVPKGARGAFIPAAFAQTKNPLRRLRRMLVALPAAAWIIPAEANLRVRSIEERPGLRIMSCDLT